MTCTEWPKETRLLLIIVGKFRGIKSWQEQHLLSIIEISASWHILMRVKQRLLSVSFSIPAFRIKVVKCMKALRLWTGWDKSKNVELPLHRQQQRASGMGWINNFPSTALILLIHLDTLILLLRWSVLCAC